MKWAVAHLTPGYDLTLTLTLEATTDDEATLERIETSARNAGLSIERLPPEQAP